MITRQQLEIINRRTLRYPLQIAEKDYFLAVILQIIAESPVGARLIFKGGTALHHCYLEQYRFSEDLDFSADKKPLTLGEARGMFAEVDYLKIKRDYISGATIKIQNLQYTGPLVQPNYIKVDIDFLQNVLLPPQKKKYRNVWGLDFEVNVMDIREVAAEKIRAMSDRARYRDFYDLFSLLRDFTINLPEIIGYIKQKEIRRPVTKTSIKNNWLVIATQKEAEMRQIYFSRPVEDSDIETLIKNLPFEEIS
ncbi:MAG: nucleotidyl transferase AbiEii/AbiGii toxin family protein [Candidatus Magasanikbacteria bacterium]|nr:nucleotidyl transferase AbiEii/AbiGii toxin family protein [Candidatus Magasanikbacteria bacterium]